MKPTLKHALWPVVTLLLTLAFFTTPVASQTTLTLKQIMADPDWIGQPVQEAWWQLDGESVIYTIERPESDLIDTYQINLNTGESVEVEFTNRAALDGAEPVFSPDGNSAAFIRDGNVFLRDLTDGSLSQLTRDTSNDRQVMFNATGESVYFLRGNQWMGVEIASGLQYPVSDLRFAPDPDQDSEDSLTQMQLRLFSSLAEDERLAKERRAERRQAANEDPTQAPAPWYLGDKYQPVASSLSPSGQYLLMVVAPKNHARGREGSMPHYVTVDGYIENEAVRTRVGRNDPTPHHLWLLDLDTHTKHELAFDELSTIQDDPLADLRAANELKPWPEETNRDVSINAIQWHPTGDVAAIQLRARDNKDRWIATLDPTDPQLIERHRLHDPAWINWRYNEMGWFADEKAPKLWFLSEETGYSHLYTIGAFEGRAMALTQGEFEVSEPALHANQTDFYVLANREDPGRYDLYRLNTQTRDFLALTDQGGVESFALHPNAERILIRYSAPYLPPQLGLVSTAGGEIEALTDTRTDVFQAMEWQAPIFVEIPGSHGQSPVPAKFYPARTPRPAGGHPVVLFVHGAGYLQNVWHRYPNYFREQMFHNFLTERGYHVLDMDFRASAGYGRDWRTAIYRQMGTPELEDLIDGVSWVVNEHGGNPERVGLYGGSYGGFMTFMALFKAPEIFKAGAALRPVSDWAHYNHPYTSNILNTPDIDPEAYRRSSPIEFADGLEGHLLMTHGMLDNNVFYQDVVRLSQVFLDLEKENWELASYPLERHGFQRPNSWWDQYRRIYLLFEETIGYDNPSH